MNRRGFKGIFILLLLGLFFSPAQEAAARDRSILEVGLRPGVSFADEVGLGTVQGLATLHYLPACSIGATSVSRLEWGTCGEWSPSIAARATTRIRVTRTMPSAPSPCRMRCASPSALYGG